MKPFEIHRATKCRAKLRLGMSGPAGSGKTYSALLMAHGLGGPIGMIDTEHGSGDLYADLLPEGYDVLRLEPPSPLHACDRLSMMMVCTPAASSAWSASI